MSYTAILLVNLGSPSEPTEASITAYLREFLSDRRVVDLPAFFWQPILRGIVLRTRPSKLVPKYQAIWREDGSPLVSITAQQAARLNEQLLEKNIKVYWAMRYQNPSIAETLQKIHQDAHQQVLVLPMYPQFSHTTTSTMVDEINRVLKVKKYRLNVEVIASYYQHPSYINALKQSVLAHWQNVGQPDFVAGDRLLLSFHGLPVKNIEHGDPYQSHCIHTYELLMVALGLTAQEVQIAYQSRFGAQKWLQPSTQSSLECLAKQKCKRVDVICPGFPADCLETLEEIAVELKNVYLLAGGKNYHYITCLNDNETHIDMMTQLVKPYV